MFIFDIQILGGATESQVQKALELLNSDEKVKAILVNIFGGIMRCDVIAAGVLNGAAAIGLKKPIIIRLKGTNVKEAKELIANSSMKMIATDDLDDAALKAVKVAELVEAGEKAGISMTFSIE